MNAATKNLLQLHGSVVLFGLSGLFAKLISVNPLVIVFGRTLFASLTIYIASNFLKQSLKLPSKENLLQFIFMGLTLAFHWIAFFNSIQKSTVAIGLIAFSTFPIFVTFMEPYFSKEKIRPVDILVAFITFAGICLVVPEFSLANNITQGLIWGIGAGLSCAIITIQNKSFVQDIPSMSLTFYQNSVACIALLPTIFFVEIKLNQQDIILILILGVIFTAFGQAVFIKGLTNIKAQLASIITSLEPLYGIVFAAIILNEIPSMRTILGGVVILAATSYATISHRSPAVQL